MQHTSEHSQMFLPTVCVAEYICRQLDVLTHGLQDSTHLHTATCSYPWFVRQHKSAHSQMFLLTICVTVYIRTQPHVLVHGFCASTYLHTATHSYPWFVRQHTSAHSQMFLLTVCVTAHICTQLHVLTYGFCDSTHLHTATCSYLWFAIQHTSAHSQMSLLTVCVTAHICTHPRAQGRISQEQLEPTGSILQTQINVFIDQLSNDLNWGKVPVCRADCSEDAASRGSRDKYNAAALYEAYVYDESR